MRIMDVCFAQILLDFFAIEDISSAVLSEMLGCSRIKTGVIMQELSWKSEVVTIRLSSGRYSQQTIYHRKDMHKDMNGNYARLARRKAARLLLTTPENLQEACA